MNPAISNKCSDVLISDQIKFMIKGFPGECVETNNETLDRYFNVDCTYNWKEIQKLFPVDFADFELTYDFGASCVVKLRSIWMRSEFHCTKVLQNSYEQFISCSKWTHSEDMLWNFLTAEHTETSTIENTLLITSVLENSLGNVYFSLANKVPPHLLKDLLNCHELEEAFETFPIFFLKILLGSPNCVNIRNILWHGFCSVDDIPSYYPAVLFLCIVSLSKALEIRNIKIIPRMKTPYPASFFEKIKSFHDDGKLRKEINNMEGWISTSIIPITHVVFWKRLCSLYRSGSYARFIVLILPQLELLFRIIYGSLNQVNVSAKCGEYYVIMDTLFKESTDDFRINKIYSAIAEGVLKLTFDLFISPRGPRIRDKISHGEMDMTSIDDHHCSSTLLNLSLCIMNSEFNLDSYESVCHPNPILWSSIISTEAHILKTRSVEIPEQLQCYVASHSDPHKFDHKAKTSVESNIKIFLRPAKESEIVAYLRNIVEFVKTACCNIMESLDEKIETYEKRTLRSKRRQTFFKILQNLSKTLDVLDGILNASKIVFVNMQSRGESFLAEHGVSLLKFSKHVSSLVMNLSKHCHKQNNDWERCENLCLKFYELLKENNFLFE